MKLSEKKTMLVHAAQHLIENAKLMGMVLTIEAIHEPNGNYKIFADARPVRGADGEYEKEPK